MLVAVLASPPLTEGQRTRRRVELAARMLGYETAVIANLIGVATADVGELATLGATAEPWLNARQVVADALDCASAVILGWGTSEPGGAARLHHRSQVAWVRDAIAVRRLATWTVGGTPRHPSRWQRYTARAHPGITFETALAASLLRHGGAQ